VLGAPVRPADRAPLPEPPKRDLPPEPVTPPAHVTPAAAVEPPPAPQRRAKLGAPESAGDPVPARDVEPVRRTEYNPDEPDPVNELLTTRSSERTGGGRPGEKSYPRERSSGKFGDKIGEKFGNAMNGVFGAHDWFRSDHCFDGFISPVTNPFLFEDPRSLTEVRPIFMYQQIPGGQPDFKGGSVWYFGTQARLAVTERLSFTFNKLGAVATNPGSGSPLDNQFGFAELWLGPKYTFLRGEQTGSLLAGGLQFQIPVGSGSVYQNTGSLSLVPYLTYGQNFGRNFRLGSFNTILATGYAASVNNQRSDYYWLSAHLDFDWGNTHRFYPLAELNWFYYTTNGKTSPFTGEGRDLFNFGSNASGTGLVTAAFGARYKITESAQVGGAFELPIGGARDLFKYRFTVDFILKY
jgi:hypothetical protein